jgi:hypothetical protein
LESAHVTGVASEPFIVNVTMTVLFAATVDVALMTSVVPTVLDTLLPIDVGVPIAARTEAVGRNSASAINKGTIHRRLAVASVRSTLRIPAPVQFASLIDDLRKRRSTTHCAPFDVVRSRNSTPQDSTPADPQAGSRAEPRFRIFRRQLSGGGKVPTDEGPLR